jgi:hypothetical protein
MRPLRLAQNPAVAVLVAVLLGACAPRSAYRQAEEMEADAGDDAAQPEPSPADDDAATPDAPSDDAVVLPALDAALDRMPTAPPPSDGGGEPALPGKTALLIVSNPATVAADDTKIKARLEAKGFTVTIGDDDGPPTQAAGMTLIVLSGSAASATLGTKYQAATAAVLCLDPFVFGNMKMTGPTRDADFGQLNASQIAIALETHPIAAGHPRGNLAVAMAATSVGWGIAPPTADRIATVVGMANRHTVFAYETGQMMAGLPAPGRRVGMFAASPTPDRLNMAGWQMFDAAIEWLTRP